MSGAALQQQHEQASDFDLVRLARQGDEQAFAEIVNRYSPRVFRVASRFFRQRDAVEEAAQETFLKIYTQLKSFEERGSFEGWVTRIATNTCINLLRAAKRRPQSAEPDLTEDETDWLEQQLNESGNLQKASVEDNLIAADLAEKLLDTLSAEDRAALMMMDGDDMSVKEVAGITGWSESKVKMRAMRARQRMRQAVENLFKSQ
ncbi:MAG: sigma-70 family RNA polymerase sigma factor [Acidobacteriota bacterium]